MKYLFTFLSLLLFLPGVIRAESSLVEEPYNLSNESKKSVVIRTIGFPPYGIKGRSSTGGIYYEMANKLIEEAGYQPENSIAPYSRIIRELKSGKADMTIMFKYEELKEHVIYVAPLPALPTVVIGLKGTAFESVESLKGKELAYLRGAKFSEQIDKDPEIRKYSTVDFVQGVKMLKRGRVDGIIGPIDPILSAAKQLNDDFSLFGEPLVVKENTPWVQISKKSKAKLSIEKLNEAYKKLQSQNTLEALRDKYL
ncbi:substrate-binding periplasmic protein [Neptuniibacter sp. QD48_11]|uniref:substrate-binding periplasmic protein n=1 Tax=unclassified Neptuniibacter TaxID=2630693 RepID=UPI0039F5E718